MSRSRIRLAIAGCAGGRGSWFAGEAARHPDFVVTSLVDPVLEAARVVARVVGLPDAEIHQNVESSLTGAPWDALLVATPDWEHASSTIAALRARRHVYVEKPLALTLEDCLAIEDADRDAGRRTMVGFNLRHAPLYHRVRELVREGRIGRLLTLQADEHYYGGRTYFRRWNRLRSRSGGLWITKACHDFDLIAWLVGDDPVTVGATAALTHYGPRPEAGERCSACTVEASCPDAFSRTPTSLPAWWPEVQSARESSGAWEPRDLCLYNSPKDTFDHGSAQITFAGGAVASYTVNVVASFTDRSLLVAGTEGAIRGSLESPTLELWRRHAAGGPETLSARDPGGAAGGHGGGDANLLTSFARFVRGDRTGVVGPAEASVAVALGLAATRASDTSTVVRLADLVGWDRVRRAREAGV